MSRGALLVAVLVLSCSRQDSREQVASCRAITSRMRDVASCLMDKYKWDGRAAADSTWYLMRFESEVTQQEVDCAAASAGTTASPMRSCLEVVGWLPRPADSVANSWAATARRVKRRAS